MLIKQVSAFVENKSGRLAEIAEVLANNGINISALQVADAAEYGVLRMIVDDPDACVACLKESGVVGKVTDVLAVAMADVPGGFAKLLRVLTDAGIDVKYLYACIGRTDGKALMVFKTDDLQKAESVLAGVGETVRPDEIYRL